MLGSKNVNKRTEKVKDEFLLELPICYVETGDKVLNYIVTSDKEYITTYQNLSNSQGSGTILIPND